MIKKVAGGYKVLRRTEEKSWRSLQNQEGSRKRLKQVEFFKASQKTRPPH